MKKKHKAILYIITSAFCFALMNCFVKLAGNVPTMQKSFFRNAIAFITAAFILATSKVKTRPKASDIPYLFVRSAAGTVGILCNFYAIDHMSAISDASMLNKMSPFFAIVFSFLIIKEKPKLFQTVGVIIAFIGSLFIIKPSFNISDTLPALIGFTGGMGAGLAYAFVRILSGRGVPGAWIVVFFSAFSCLITVPALLLHYSPMTFRQLFMLLGAGLAATGGQFSITAAYSNAPAKEISIYDYSQIIFAAMLGFFLFGDIPDIYSVLGYVIILAASFVVFLFNKKEAA
ncbi:MAG: DMT family transporter [Firmicutes bacterium]|nr:DMT family transporter [Bacillota bacterium]